MKFIDDNSHKIKTIMKQLKKQSLIYKWQAQLIVEKTNVWIISYCEVVKW